MIFRRRNRELADEIQAHIEEKASELMDEGMPEKEARERARREFGNPTLVIETSREVWSSKWLEQLIQDLRYALRTFKASPASRLSRCWPWRSASAQQRPFSAWSTG